MFRIPGMILSGSDVTSVLVPVISVIVVKLPSPCISVDNDLIVYLTR